MASYKLAAGMLLAVVQGVPVVREATTTFIPPAGPTPPTVPVTNVTYHGPFTGTATTTGALSTVVLGPSIAPKPANPIKYLYPADGQLHQVQPAPYTPGGGQGNDGELPVYRPQSDFDYQSLALALYQEWIELDLFHWGLATFSERDFADAGLTTEDRFLIEFMANQEVGHATLLTNILGAQAPRQCSYQYPVSNVREFVDFCQKLTRYGESGVYGFLGHLDSRESATLLLQSISTEARQQMIFRQFEGLFPMPVWFEVGVPQSWAWTLLAPYISSCPAGQTRLAWQNFPAVKILNQPNPFRVDGSDVWNETTGPNVNTASTDDVNEASDCLEAGVVGANCAPGITRNRTIPLSYPGRQVFFEWAHAGQPIGPNNSYVTSTTAAAPRFAAWVTQLNVTYTPLHRTADTTGFAFQPDVSTFAGDPAVNGTMFIVLTDEDLYVTPFNISLINPHVYGVALYQAG